MKKQLIWGRKKRRIDRYDGWRVSSTDPLFSVIPHIMKNRCDSQVFFDETVEITELERFIRRQRRESPMVNLSMLYLLIAAMLRIISQYPCVNRFVCGRRIYARNSIEFSFMIKREMTLAADELCVKVKLEPADTLQQVYDKINAAIEAALQEDASTGTDSTAKILAHCPSFVVKFIVFLANALDQHGWMPRWLHEFSPFHATLYLTDIGSTGIDSVYHHLYNFGNCSMFCSLGKKRRETVLDSDGKPMNTRSVDLRFTVDERVAGGYYFASAMRDCVRLLKSPEALLTPPEKVVEDPGIPPRLEEAK